MIQQILNAQAQQNRVYQELLLAQQYQRDIPFPGAAGAPLFQGRNITKFLEEWEELCDKAQWDNKLKVQKFSKYCKESQKQWQKLAEDLNGYKD